MEEQLSAAKAVGAPPPAFSADATPAVTAAKSLVKSSSIASCTSVESSQSFNSEDLEDEETLYETAPYDLFFDSPQLGKILVLKAGQVLPCLTKYKKTKKGGLVLIRFRFYTN